MALLGALHQMEEDGLLGTVLYLGGVSGSTWWELHFFGSYLFFYTNSLEPISTDVPFHQDHGFPVQRPRVEHQHECLHQQAVHFRGESGSDSGLAGEESRGRRLFSHSRLGGVDLSWDHETGRDANERVFLPPTVHWPMISCVFSPAGRPQSLE